MKSHKSDVSFKSPPLIEVSISVQFEPLQDFHVGLIGLILNEFRDRYPNVSHDNPLEHKVEKFGGIERVTTPKFRFMEKIELPRVQFSSANFEYMIQLQEDRFILNWKSGNGSCTYPRHEKLRKCFLDELAIFEKIVNQDLIYDQVEMSYVNHIDVSDRATPEVFSDLLANSHFKKQEEIESFSINWKKIIMHKGQKVGRMYTAVDKAIRVSDNAEVFVLKFVTRAHPFTRDSSGICPAIELMRQKINESFVSLTTEGMHDIWNKES
jgi:uncharacterized protein (TIGR04255 family)